MSLKESTIANVLKNNDVAETTPIVTETAPTPIVTEVPTVADVPIDNTIVVPEPIVETPIVAKVEEDVITFEFPSEETTPITEVTPQQTQPQLSWKDQAKLASEDELSELLGDDDFIKGMRKHIKNGGAPSDYIYAKGINWESVSDADLIKSELRKDFPDATPTQIERLFNKKYSQTDIAEEEDKEDGMLLMKSDARKVRAEKISTQQKFQIPEAKQLQQTQVQQPQIDPDKQARLQKDGEFIIAHEATKNLFQSKRVAIEIADGVKQNVSIPNPQALMDVFFKAGTLEKLTRTPQGEPDVQLLQEAAMFIANRAQFKKSIYNAGKEAGKKELVEEGQNAGKQATIVAMQQTNQANYGEAFSNGIKQGTAAKFVQQ